MAEPTIELSNGVRMPLLALGTAPLCAEAGANPHNPRFVGFLPEDSSRSVNLALTAGIRHIDTALLYRTQPHIARVLGQWFSDGRLSRQDVFLTSKVYHPPAPSFATDDSAIHMDDMSVDQVADAVRSHFQRCLAELGVGYVDLMLLHWPGSGGGLSPNEDRREVDNEGKTTAAVVDIDPVKRAKRIAAWKVLEEFYEVGWARAIGVSNFTEIHLEHLMEDGAKYRPMVNQLETSIYIRHDGIIKYCQDNGIVVQAYSPFGRGVNSILEDRVVRSVAEKHSKTPGQVALRHIIQQGIAPIFLSSSEERIRSNMRAVTFELDNDDTARLGALQKTDGGSWGLPSPCSIP